MTNQAGPSGLGLDWRLEMAEVPAEGHYSVAGQGGWSWPGGGQINVLGLGVCKSRNRTGMMAAGPPAVSPKTQGLGPASYELQSAHLSKVVHTQACAQGSLSPRSSAGLYWGCRSLLGQVT